MYRLGHYGGALLVYAPFGGVLLAARFATAAIAGGAVMVALAGLPDVDQQIPFVSHRGPTHTVGFALLVGLAVGAVGFALGSPGGSGLALGTESGPASPVALGAFGFLVGALSVVSHLLADALTPMGIKPFWPVSSAHYTLGLTRADNTLANYALLAAGVMVTAVTGLVAAGL